MTTNRTIDFHDIRPGDTIWMYPKAVGENEPAMPLHVTVASTEDKVNNYSVSGIFGYRTIEITTASGAVICEAEVVPAADEDDFRISYPWDRVELVVLDDREALLQDLELVHRGDPGYESNQRPFADALARVLAQALLTLGPGTAKSARSLAKEE